MDSLGTSSNEMPINHVEILKHSNDIEANPNQDMEENNIDYSQRAQCLGEAVSIGAKTGLFITTLLMMAVEALNEDIIAMLLAGFLGLVAGACSMPIEDFASVDTEEAEMKVHDNKHNKVEEDDKLNPFQASLASAIGFCIGGVVPVLTAVFIRDYKIRLLVISVAVSALLVFGGIGAALSKSKTPARRTGESSDWRLEDYGYYFWL